MKTVVTESLTPITRAQFQEQALMLAKEIVDKVLRPSSPLRTTVVMEALMVLYCRHAESLPPEAKVDVAMALGGIAGELLQGASTTQSSAASATTH